MYDNQAAAAAAAEKGHRGYGQVHLRLQRDLHGLSVFCTSSFGLRRLRRTPSSTTGRRKLPMHKLSRRFLALLTSVGKKDKLQKRA